MSKYLGYDRDDHESSDSRFAHLDQSPTQSPAEAADYAARNAAANEKHASEMEAVWAEAAPSMIAHPEAEIRVRPNGNLVARFPSGRIAHARQTRKGLLVM